MPDLSDIINRSKNSDSQNRNNQETSDNIKSTASKETVAQENKPTIFTKSNNTSDLQPTAPSDVQNAVKRISKNILPIANAGKNQISIEGSNVILDGSKSKDRDGSIDSYQWQQIRGPKVN